MKHPLSNPFGPSTFTSQVDLHYSLEYHKASQGDSRTTHAEFLRIDLLTSSFILVVLALRPGRIKVLIRIDTRPSHLLRNLRVYAEHFTKQEGLMRGGT